MLRLQPLLGNFELPEGYTYAFTGEQQEQEESMAFLGRAMLIALALILLILVSQFNSIIRPAIIFASIVFSTIGVFGGISTFRMDFVVVMTGIGIVSLAGIVVNNAIVLVDYIELLKARRRKDMGLGPDAFLPLDVANKCIIEAGKDQAQASPADCYNNDIGTIAIGCGTEYRFSGIVF